MFVSFMETKAVTFWKGIISPVYDAAKWILIVPSDGKREIVDVGGMSIYEKAEFLDKKYVNVLICGAISNLAQAALSNKRIEVLSWVRGPVEEVLQAHLLNALKTKPFLMPGCGRGECIGRKRKYQRGGKHTVKGAF